jgi:hypothetical protein
MLRELTLSSTQQEHEMTQLSDLISSLNIEQAYDWSDLAAEDTDYSFAAQSDFVRSLLETAGLQATGRNIDAVSAAFERLIETQVEIDYGL